MKPIEPIFTVEPPLRPRPQPPKKNPGGVMSGLIALGVIVFKFIGPILLFFKTGLSMLLSIGAYSLIFGWKFAAGLVILIFIHEMGHFMAAKCYRIPVTAPMFIPFAGAYVLLKNRPLDAWTNAIISYAGPLAGGLGGWVCYELALSFDSRWMVAVALYTFILNLFNMLPIVPLDGSHLWICFSRRFTPNMTFPERIYLGLLLAGLIAGMLLGCLESWQYLHPSAF